MSKISTKLITPKKSLKGSITIPGDKSITHRAIMLSSIANGPSIINNAHVGKDCLATIQCLKA
ncbi:MAG: 3-phosphoshikimate 1-carboxyvinyltransferase, partial [Lachnospiraceae bacterium]|nr:3-phosphoshikimate 1-carboxyvinyltransferase [Lachnospiraceae bacterium]